MTAPQRASQSKAGLGRGIPSVVDGAPAGGGARVRRSRFGGEVCATLIPLGGAEGRPSAVGGLAVGWQPGNAVLLNRLVHEGK